jgi:hypothetical protein
VDAAREAPRVQLLRFEREAGNLALKVAAVVHVRCVRWW